jgi:putative Mg2+ transporter-C (MgtC) family protein
VTGIGFLGAGTILRSRDRVHGLTTAATVWVNAALGTAAGAGLFQLALTAGALTLAVLIILSRIEIIVERKIGLRPRD